MAQKGLDFKVQVGPESTADGAGAAVTTLNTVDSIFKDEDVGRGIDVGGSSTTIDSVTDANTVELAAVQTWDDGDEVKLDEVVVGEQRNATFQVGSQVIDVTSKDDDQITALLASIRNYQINFSSLYVYNDSGLVDLILAAINGYRLNVTVTNANGTSDDRKGECLLAQLQVAAPYTDASMVTATLQMSGALTIE